MTYPSFGLPNARHPFALRRQLCHVFLSALVAAPLAAQEAPAPAPAKLDDDSVLVLSPFTVSGDADTGYSSNETLAGSRLKTNLRDVPSQVQVMTTEFLNDIAAGSVEEAFRYSINVENLNEYSPNSAGDFNSGVINVNGLSRARGIETPGNTHDFFKSWLPRDSYNTERITFSSGPNAILFGNSNPAGTIDTSFARANVQRAKRSVTVRVDSEKSWRTSFDFNQPIIPNKLALRLAAMREDTNDWRSPAGENNRRLFGTATYQPFSRTVVRGYYERAKLERRTARNTLARDQVTPWINAGRPAFNNHRDNPMAVPAAGDLLYTRNTLVRPVYIFGAATPVTTLSWGSANNAANNPLTNPTAAYSVITKGPGDPPYQTGTDAYDYALSDYSVSPDGISINGTGTVNFIDAYVWGGAIEQRVTKDLFIEVAYNEEKNINPVADFLRGVEGEIRADANLYLPDRVTPNPNFGRYYVEGSGRATKFLRREKEARASVSYELDLNKFNRWLGRHRLAGLIQRTTNIALQQEYLARVVPAGADYQTVLDSYTNNNVNNYSWRSYLSDPQNPATGSTYYFDLPFDPLATTVLPDGSTLYTVDNPYGATSAGTYVHNRLDGLVFAAQSFLWKDRLALTFGWRDDRARQARTVPPRRGTTTTSAFATYEHLPVPSQWSTYTNGSATTRGAVLHALPWLSVFYNESGTWSPARAARGPDGNPLPGSNGEGKDYGLMFRFFDDRISVRLNKYENTAGPAVDTSVRNTLLAPIRNIEQTLFDAADAGLIPRPPETPGYDPYAPSTDYDATSFQESTGYEFELVANMTRNWSLRLNAAKAEAQSSQVGTDWINFVRERVEIWKQYPNLTGPGTSNTTITTRFADLIGVMNLLRQSDGASTEQGRSWRANLFTRYTFDKGRLKGLALGGGYRWRDKGVIGYRATTIPNEFNFPTLPENVTVPALESPVYSRATHDIEALIGYSRKITKDVRWNVQLNVRNLLDDRDFIGQKANTSGTITNMTTPAPRTFILTNTFSF